MSWLLRSSSAAAAATALLLLLLAHTQPAATFMVPSHAGTRRSGLPLLHARPAARAAVLEVSAPPAPPAIAAAPVVVAAAAPAAIVPPAPVPEAAPVVAEVVDAADEEDEEEEAMKAAAEAKTVTIRRMTLRDVAAAFHIGEQLFSSEKFPQLYRTFSAYEVTDAMSTDPELCLVAEAIVELPPRRGRKPKAGRKKYERRVVGFVLGSITEKRKADESCGYVSWVCVEEEWQRRGIGTQLVQRLEDMFTEEGMRTVVADTPETNMPARCFLEGRGYGSPVSHVYMSLYFNAKEGPNGGSAGSKRSGGGKGGQGKAKVKIRQMEVDDLAAVFELGEEVFTHELPNLFQIWSEAEVIDLFGSDAENCFVAESEGKVVGFCLGTTIEKKHSSWRYGYLVWLAVSSKAQGLGVGKKLLHQFEGAMKEEGCRILLIDTQSDNVAARSFFSKAGFRNFEDHRYYTKVLPRQETAEEAARKEEAKLAAPSAAGRAGMPQPRLMRLTTSKKVKLMDS